MKRVACFIPSLDFGGAQIVTLNLVNSLVLNKEFIIDLVICKAEGGLSSLLDRDVNVVNLECSKVYKSFFKIRNYLLLSKPDFFISHSDIPNLISLIAKSSILKCKTKFLIVQHNYYNIEIQSIKFIGKYVPLLIKVFYPKADHIIAVSEGVKDFLNNELGNKKKIECIYNPINIKTIEENKNLPIEKEIRGNFFLFIGRLEKVKNLSFLLDVFKRFLDDCKDYDLVIIGDGSLKSGLINYAKQLGIGDKVYILGYRMNPYNYISKSALVLLTSFSEALPTIIVESIYIGKTIISTPNKGAVELLCNNLSGYVSDSFNDIDSFVELIHKGLKYPISYYSLQKLYNEKFNTSVTIDKYKQLLQE